VEVDFAAEMRVWDGSRGGRTTRVLDSAIRQLYGDREARGRGAIEGVSRRRRRKKKKKRRRRKERETGMCNLGRWVRGSGWASTARSVGRLRLAAEVRARCCRRCVEPKLKVTVSQSREMGTQMRMTYLIIESCHAAAGGVPIAPAERTDHGVALEASTLQRRRQRQVRR